MWHVRNVRNGIAEFFFVCFKGSVHGGDAIAQKFHVCNVQIQLPTPLRMVLLLCDFIRSRGEQIDLMQPFALANSGCQHRGGHLTTA